MEELCGNLLVAITWWWIYHTSTAAGIKRHHIPWNTHMKIFLCIVAIKQSILMDSGFIHPYSSGPLQWHGGNCPFYKHELTLIPAWISNHMSSKMQDELTYASKQFLQHSSLGMHKWTHSILYNECSYLFVLRLKLFHASKRGREYYDCFYCHCKGVINVYFHAHLHFKEILITSRF